MTSEDESAVLATCAGFLNCINNKNFDGLHDFIIPEGHIAIRRYDADGRAMLNHLSLADLVERLKRINAERWADNQIEETFEEPQVMIDEDLAICWTKFRLLVDGKLTAKGRNCFCLHKIDRKDWKVSGAVDRNISV